MQTTDPIADMLTRIRNATMARHSVVSIPGSRMKTEIARVLKQEGYIVDYEEATDERSRSEIRIRLLRQGKGRQQSTGIRGLKRVSKPGLRIYTKRQDIPRVRSGLGLAIISTSRGVMSGRRAYREGIGGEVLCYIW